MKKTHIVTLLRVVGILVFVAAFFLPAIRDPGAASGPGGRPMLGWSCALFAAAATGTIVKLSAGGQAKEMVGSICLILSGWVNPLVFFYLMFSIWPRFVGMRRVLAAAIVVCFVATWVFFFKAPLVPLIGHYLWVVGALMILAGEVIGMFPTRDLKDKG